MAAQLYGIIPPLTTPCTPDGEGYEEGLRQLVEFQIEKGSHGLFICGTYGSGPLMSVEQRQQVHEVVMDQAKGRILVVAHVGAITTDQAVALAQHAESIGIPYVSSISPFYYKYDERSLVAYFSALVKSVRIPVYVYNNPQAASVTITGGIAVQVPRPQTGRTVVAVGCAGCVERDVYAAVGALERTGERQRVEPFEAKIKAVRLGWLRVHMVVASLRGDRF